MACAMVLDQTPIKDKTLSHETVLADCLTKMAKTCPIELPISPISPTSEELMAAAILLDQLPVNDNTPPNGKTTNMANTPLTELSIPQSPEEPIPEPALMHRTLTAQPYKVLSAKGSYIHLASGVSILDGCGGAAVAIIGHGNQEIITAVTTQMQSVSYIHTLSYTTTSASQLASLILETPPSGYQHGLVKAHFCSSGSEANDTALKLARQYFFEKGETKRRFFVSRKQSYHGNSIACMSVSSVLARKIPYGGEDGILMENVRFVGPAYAYRYQRDGESEEEYVERLIWEVEEEFKRLGTGNVVAFIAEPVVGATSGCVVSPKGYFKGVREVCDRYGVLLILDEIMCGMGRTGTIFAFEQEGIVPDIVTVGKGLGGGYAPIAAVLMSGKVVEGLRAGSGAFNNGQTYQAHPVSCAAALAVQKIVRRENLVERCALMGILLEKLLRDTFGECKFVGNIRGRGLFWGIEFVKDRETKETFPPAWRLGYNVQQNAFNLGLAVYPGATTVDGVRGDHVIVAPPFNVSVVDLGKIVKILKEAYTQEERKVDVA